MIKTATSQEYILESIMNRVQDISCCGAVVDVGIEVNTERALGMNNWWVTRIKYQRSPFPNSDIAASCLEISRIEAALQANFFIEIDAGFQLGSHV